jgi:hypothetical protein
MKKTIKIITALFIIASAKAQQDIVTWRFTANKVADKTYEMHLTASVDDPWHIYSQSTPPGGPLATSIHFDKNPVLMKSGEVKEIGKMEKKHDPTFDVDIYYYDDKVDFVQVVKLKSEVKTTVSGFVKFMACDDHQCLQPQKTAFKILLN